MTLPVWTTNPFTALSLGNVQSEFGGVAPISFSEYYAGAATNYVPNGTLGYPNGLAVRIPNLGSPISLSNFYGASAVTYSIRPEGNVLLFDEGQTINFIITAPDADNTTLFWTIEDLTVNINLNPPSLPAGTQNIQYSQTITASGGSGNYQFTVASGSLPTGLTLNANSGVISGRPTSTGTTAFNIQAADPGGNVGAKNYSITVANVNIVVDPISANAANVNMPYSLTFTANGGTPPYVFTISNGAIPDGLTLNSNTGVLSGAPTKVETQTFTIRATDVNTNFGRRDYSITVSNVLISISPEVISNNAVKDSPFSIQFTANGGQPPYNFVRQAGNLPANLTISSQGILSGIPTETGSFNFAVGVTDSRNNSGNRNYNLNVISTTWGVTLDNYGAAPQTVDEGSNLFFTVTAPTSVPANATVYLGYGIPMTAGNSDVSITSPTGVDLNMTPVQLVNRIGKGNILVVNDTIAEPNEYFTVFVDYPLGTRAITYGNVIIRDRAVWNITLSGYGSAPQTVLEGENLLFTITAPTSIPPNAVVDLIGGPPYDIETGDILTNEIPTVSPTVFRSVQLTNWLGSGIITVASDGQVEPNEYFSVYVEYPSGTRVVTYGNVIIRDRSNVTITTATLPGGTVGTPYSATLQSSGGSGAYTYTLINGTTLPSGLQLSSAGAITGTPTVASTTTFTVQSSSPGVGAGTKNFTISVALSSTWKIILDGYGAAPQTVNEGSTLYFNITAPSTVPQNAVVFLGTGNPATAGTGDILTVSDPNAVQLTNWTGTGNISIVADSTTEGPEYLTVFVDYPSGTRVVTYGNIFINDSSVPGTVIITTQSPLTPAIQGVAYTRTLASINGVGPWYYEITAGALPAGLTLESGGTISGTPQGAGTFTFTIRSSAGSGANPGTKQFTLVVNSAGNWAITLDSYGGAPQIVNEGSVLSFTITSPANVPDGSTVYLGTSVPLLLSSCTTGYVENRKITGRTVGTTVWGSNPYTSDSDFAKAAVHAGLLADGETKVIRFTALGQQNGGFVGTTANGVTTLNYTNPWCAVQIALAPDQTVDTSATAADLVVPADPQAIQLTNRTATGTIQILADTLAEGTEFFTVFVDYPLGTRAVTYGNIVINDTSIPSVVQITTSSLPNGAVGVAYQFDLKSTGGVGPWYYDLAPGSNPLPSGLSLSGGGRISGVPTTAGSTTVTFRSSAASGANSGTKALTITIDSSGAWSITLNGYGAAPQSIDEGQTLTFTITAPTNIPQNATVFLGTGVPGDIETNDLSIPNSPNSVQLTNWIGTGTITIAADQTTDGPEFFTVFVDYPSGTRVVEYGTININDTSITPLPDVVITTASPLPSGNVGVFYYQTLSSTQGNAPYGYSVISGSLPSGLSLQPNGTLSGSPAAQSQGTATFTIRSSASGGANPGTKQFSLTINVPSIVITTNALADGVVGVSYNRTIFSTGGAGGPYNYTVGGGNLPPGLTVSSTGVVSGTPTQVGTYSFNINVSETGSTLIGTRSFTVVISAAPVVVVTIGPENLATGTVNTSYTQTLTASGGNGPYTFSVSSGTLPPGVSMNGDGSITGTPTQQGQYTFVVTAAGTVGSGSKQYTITVNPATVVALISPPQFNGGHYIATGTQGTAQVVFELASTGQWTASGTADGTNQSLQEGVWRSIVANPKTYALRVVAVDPGNSPTGSTNWAPSSPTNWSLIADGVGINTLTVTNNTASSEVSVLYSIEIRSNDLSEGPVSAQIRLTASKSGPVVLPNPIVTLTTTPSGVPVVLNETNNRTLKVNYSIANRAGRTITWQVVGLQPYPAVPSFFLGDFDESPPTDSHQIQSDSGSFTIIMKTDQTTEQTESFTFRFGLNGITNQYPFDLVDYFYEWNNRVDVEDTSKTPSGKTYIISATSIEPGPVTVTEGTGIVFSVGASNVNSGDIIYWDIVADPSSPGLNSADFDGVLTGTATIFQANDSIFNTVWYSAYITIVPTADNINDIPEVFRVNLRESPGGPIVATSNPVTINVDSNSGGSWTIVVNGESNGPITVNEGWAKVDYTITAPANVPANATINVEMVNPRTAGFEDITFTTPKVITMTNRVGTGSFRVENDQLTEGQEYFTLGVIYQNVTVATFGPINIADLSVSPTQTVAITTASTLPNGRIGVAYSQQLSSTGGSGNYTYDLWTGSPPPGIVLRSTGLIEGSPTASGSYSFFVRSSVASGANPGIKEFILTVDSAGSWSISLNGTPPGVTNVSRDEGETLYFTISAPSSVPPNAQVILGTGAPNDASAADISTPLTPNTVQLSNGTGIGSITLTADLLTEGSEYFTVFVDYNGSRVVTFGLVYINDTSLTPGGGGGGGGGGGVLNPDNPNEVLQ